MNRNIPPRQPQRIDACPSSATDVTTTPEGTITSRPEMSRGWLLSEYDDGGAD